MLNFEDSPGFAAINLPHRGAGGFDLNLGPTITVGVSYAGQFANDLQDNAVKGRFSWVF